MAIAYRPFPGTGTALRRTKTHNGYRPRGGTDVPVWRLPRGPFVGSGVIVLLVPAGVRPPRGGAGARVPGVGGPGDPDKPRKDPKPCHGPNCPPAPPTPTPTDSPG